MAIRRRKIYVIHPDKYDENVAYYFHGLERAEAEEMCLAFAEDLIEDNIQKCQYNEHYGVHDALHPDWWMYYSEAKRLRETGAMLYERELIDYGH